MNEPSLLESVGTTLRSHREARGLSLSEAARRAGVSRMSLFRWETGVAPASAGALARLFEALEFDARTRTRLLAGLDPRHARIELAHGPLGPPVDVGMVLRAMRRRRGLTQTELARTVGATQSTIAKWENGDASPSAGAVHVVGFALGASAEETVALSMVRGEEPIEVPDDPEVARRIAFDQHDRAPLDLKACVSLAWEAAFWRRAARDPRWEPALISILSYWANWLVLAERFDEVDAVVRRVFRMATDQERLVQSVPAIGAAAMAARRRGDPAAGAQRAGAWAGRLPDSAMRGWMLQEQGRSLIAMDRANEGIGLVEDAVEMYGRFNAYPDDDAHWCHRTAQLSEAYLAAGRPARAAALIGGRHDRLRLLDPSLYLRVELACGRPVPEGVIVEARESVQNNDHLQFARMLRRMDKVERTQARLLDEA